MGREITRDRTGMRHRQKGDAPLPVGRPLPEMEERPHLRAVSLRPSFETPASGGLLRMRTECAAAISQAPMSMSLILRRPQSGRLEGRGVRSGRSKRPYAIAPPEMA